MLLYKKSNQLFANVDANIQEMIIWYLDSVIGTLSSLFGTTSVCMQIKILTVNFIKSKYRLWVFPVIVNIQIEMGCM